MFKTIPNFTKYEISTDGKVFRRQCINTQYQPAKGEYVEVTLPRKEIKTSQPQRYVVCHLIADNGKKTTCLLHRLLMQTYKPVEDSSLVVNHIDGDRTNNTLSNLEWVTQQDNIIHSWNNGLSTMTNNQIIAASKQVGQYTVDGELIKVWPSTQELGRAGYTQSSVSRVCSGKRQTHKGFVWKYV